mmetsp:Transcript_8057/g.19411  ORF Transcript_8057/g.19411 Transcript_8057/m.19411 type:complete len:84 (-) Transcript_8057:297-548(-)
MQRIRILYQCLPAHSFSSAIYANNSILDKLPNYETRNEPRLWIFGAYALPSFVQHFELLQRYPFSLDSLCAKKIECGRNDLVV